MDIPGNIEKRIKRHVLGKTRSFYISTTPGMERICLDELGSLGFLLNGATLDKGGVEVEARIHECYIANLTLRTANRILMRIDAFGATHFRQLQRRASETPWELYLGKTAAIKIHVTARQSRLFHSGAIADVIETQLKKRFQPEGGGLAENQSLNNGQGMFHALQRVFVRAVDDRFTVSIDSSGDLLHKRGLKIYGGRAPIRETLASGILALAGYVPGEPLLDPMAGAGTFSLEAAMIANGIPAGWFRSFAFMGWPSFRPARWEHIRAEAQKSIRKPIRPQIFASDNDPAACRTLQAVVVENGLADTIIVSKKNFFDLFPPRVENPGRRSSAAARDGLIAINPPFGRRLEAQDQGEKIFVEIGKKLKTDFKGWKIALIAPKKALVRKVPFKVHPHEFSHGGLNLTLLTGRID